MLLRGSLAGGAILAVTLAVLLGYTYAQAESARQASSNRAYSAPAGGSPTATPASASPTPGGPTATSTATPAAQLCNPAVITIPSTGTATPYPSTIQVAGLTGTVSRVSVTLNRLRHDFEDDLDILLVGPQGQSVILMSDAGGSCPLQRTLTFEDGYPLVPDESCPTDGATYAPTNYPPDPDTFPSPAPVPPYGSSLSVFNGTDPNGTWSLYVVDDYQIFAGAINGGWCLTLYTSGAGGGTPTGTATPTASLTPPATPTGISTAPPMVTATPTGVSTAPPTATGTPCAVTFSDVQPADYFYEPVRYLYCHGVISGYGDGTFRPYNETTRAQMVKIVVLGFGLPTQTPAGGAYTFHDVSPGAPFFDVIETAAADSIVSGYACGPGGPGPCDAQNRPYFLPNNPVTRGQLSKIDAVAAGWPLLNPATATFSDVPPGSAFYLYVETAVCHGVVSGYADHTFHPFASATRGQISKIVYLSIVEAPGGCMGTPTGR